MIRRCECPRIIRLLLVKCSGLRHEPGITPGVDYYALSSNLFGPDFCLLIEAIADLDAVCSAPTPVTLFVFPLPGSVSGRHRLNRRELMTGLLPVFWVRQVRLPCRQISPNKNVRFPRTTRGIAFGIPRDLPCSSSTGHRHQWLPGLWN